MARINCGPSFPKGEGSRKMESTIVAISTAPGEGGIGIVRISGERSRDYLDQIFVAKNSKGLEPRCLTYGHIISPQKPGQVIDECLAVFFPGPKTYTGEDLAEIQCHGSMVALRKVLKTVQELGASLAEPGEFTKRAFLNGRLDLSQAEAVIDLIKAKTEKGFQVAMDQLEGTTSLKIRELREKTRDLMVQITVNIEYPEEDIEEITYGQMEDAILSISNDIKKLLDTAHTGRILKEGLAVAIIGKPNVGKSSLMNALLKENRAIVTEIPGTTRDTIEEWLSIRNIPLRIIDTAGIRETDDLVEKIGIEKAKQSFMKADLVVLVLDGSQELSSEDKMIMELVKDQSVIVLLNKRDLGKAVNHQAVEGHLPKATIVETSVTEEMGISEIEDKIEEMVYGGRVKQEADIIITQVRHQELLEKAGQSCKDALVMIHQKEALDFIEVDIRNAHEALGEIIGETVKDDVINEVFNRFCLGK